MVGFALALVKLNLIVHDEQMFASNENDQNGRTAGNEQRIA